ncbi:MAG: SDR family NAD(P)-dependent oxidoreductase [Bacteroidales bacterium]|jgi:short-subunit dehydrogenase|nr:SDR family NAD(P)-dependent oxidoreductase [Bacteroidales bacterium]
MKLQDKTILITGGASGIGRIMGRLALQQGARAVAVWDINEKNIAATVADHAKYGTAKSYRVDVSSYDAVVAAYADTTRDLGPVDIVIQCAGVVTSNKPFHENSVTDINRTMTINAVAPMYVGLVVLQDMVARDHGQLVTIASAAGMLSMPKMSIYVASKWSAIGWSDSVRIELQRMKSKVQITTVAPYFINTGMFDGVQSKIFPILDPEKTARKILKATAKGKTFAGIPFKYHFIRFMEGIFPERLFDWVFGDIFGLYTTMDHFTGRRK